MPNFGPFPKAKPGQHFVEDAPSTEGRKMLMVNGASVPAAAYTKELLYERDFLMSELVRLRKASSA